MRRALPHDRCGRTDRPDRGARRLRGAGRALVVAAGFAALASGPPRAAAQAVDIRGSSQIIAVSDAGPQPGDDFFGYANADWLAATTIPAGKERWGARDELEAQARQRVASLLAGAGTAPAGSPARRVADFRAAYLNEPAIAARGLAPLRPELDRIAGIATRQDLARALGRSLRADVDPLGFGIYDSASVLGIAVEQSIHGERTNTAFLVQGGLGLPDRDDYLSAEPAKTALRTRYRAHIRTLLALAGFDRADSRAAAVLALETELARTHATREASANDHDADTLWQRGDFAEHAPGLDWPALLAEAGLAGEREIAIWQPAAITGLATTAAARPLEEWKDYLRFHALASRADVLQPAFADEALAFRAEVEGKEPPTRAERALAATEATLADDLGAMYTERYFPAAQKARILAIAERVRAALLARVAAAAWMSPATRASAVAKLQSLYVGIGYPEHRADRSAGPPPLAVDPTDALGNLLRAEARDRRAALDRLGQPVDLQRWFIAPHSVGALLVFQQNSYVMSAALLEPPKYDPASPDAAAYGSVGALLGHDFIYYVDVLGAEYDPEHRLRHWWTAEDQRRYQALAQPLVEQFGAYQPLPDQRVDGKLTLTENIADLGGLAAAFDAYRSTLGAADPATVRAGDRAFFLAYAATQRRRIAESALRRQIATSDHAPEELRAATVRNLDAWYEAFDVRPGQRLYLDPAARVRIW